MAADPPNIVRLAEHKGTGAGEDQTALAFAEQYADCLRYVAKWGTWLRFDGVRWAPDDTLHVFDLVRQISREKPGTDIGSYIAL
jgi:putative DNA primase/helicase